MLELYGFKNYHHIVHQTALIVDDEIEICQLLTSYLTKKNIKSFYSLTLKDALEKCEKLLPEIIFLDNNLPDGSGISYIPKFMELNPSCKIIVISAMTNLTSKALSSGAAGFVSKPISFQNVESFIKE